MNNIQVNERPVGDSIIETKNTYALPLMGGSPTINSAEIAKLVGARHDNVKRTIETLVDRAVIVRPQTEDEQFADAMGRTRTTQVYQFTGEQGKRDSIVVVAQLSPEFTARLVDRWQELEAQQSQRTPRELSRMDILQLAMQSEEERLRLERENQALEHRIEVEAPRVALAKQVEISQDSISVAQAAKILGTGQRRLFAFLRQISWISRRNEPYQAKIETGYLDVKLGSFQHPDHGLKQSVTTMVTGKGLAKLQQLWSEHIKKEAA